MPISAVNRVIQQLLADSGPEGSGMTDGKLLAHFLSSRDDHALAALVRRHAAMVWGVCRRLLSHHDAEDAFQATFLVLVRKAAAVPRQAVANWLYGVARQTAVRLRATAAKRGRREKQVLNMPEPQHRGQGSAVRGQELTDLQAVLDEEMSYLPDHYRGVIVLCDLEGLTRKEAARQLGIPAGSVASRLVRGRLLLARRLTQRGIVFSGGSVAAVLAQTLASASAPPAVVASTIKAVTLVAARKTAATGVISAKVADLTQGTVTAMLMTRIKSVLAGLLLVIALSGAAGLIYQSQAAEPAQVKEHGVIVPEHLGNVEKAPDAGPQPAPPKQQPAKTDQERMVGGWVIVSNDGERNRKGEHWMIGKHQIVMHANLTGFSTITHFHRLDASKNPRQIDITVTTVAGVYGPDVPIKADAKIIGVIKGIYAFTDDTELRLCLGEMGKDRPTEFAAKHGQSELLILRGGNPLAWQQKENNGAAKAPWSEAVEGLQCWLQADKAVWKVDEVPTFKLHVRNQGKRDHVIHMAQAACKLEVDGVWFDWQAPVSIPAGTWPAGRHYDDFEVRVTLEPPWANGNKPIAVKPGKHKVRVAYVTLDLKQPVKVVSNAVEIQVGAGEPMGKEEKLRLLIDKVLSAHGGLDKLNKLTSFTMTAKHSNGETQHYFVQPPKKFRWETTHPDKTSKRIVILFPEGRRWWTKEPNADAKEFIPTGIEPLSVEGWFDYVKFFGPRQVLRLKDADHKVTLLDEEAKIGGRAAVGVQVTGPHYNRKVYFDKETHLLLKGLGSDILREVTYSDYKMVDGIPIAQKEDDGHFMPEITDFRVVEFDAKLFEQP